MEITQQQYKAIARLESSNSPDWQALKLVLSQAIESERDDLQNANSIETVYRLQGRAGALQSLLYEINKSVFKQYQ